jgi:hypothetical protein
MSQIRRPISYKTVTLSTGKHSAPEDGACVMELASMISGVPFTDRPVSVCPVIAAFLRAYNDAIDDRRRQDLYGYAVQVIGTRDSIRVEQRRVARCLAWGVEMQRRRHWASRLLARTPIAPQAVPKAESAAVLAVKAIGRHSDATHAAALRLVDELCAISSDQPAAGTALTGTTRLGAAGMA